MIAAGSARDIAALDDEVPYTIVEIGAFSSFSSIFPFVHFRKCKFEK